MVEPGVLNFFEIPLLPVVCGATATGKSKLAIELAQRFNGEVINADAIQMYAGLPVVTNKVTAEEMQNVPHHLLGILDPLQPQNAKHVHFFQQAALKAIQDIHSRGRVPILVGGTHYYLEAVLWDFLISKSSDDTHESDQEVILSDLSHLDNIALHTYLHNVDPDAASAIHPNDRRKVLRSIEIYRQTKLTRTLHWSNQRSNIPTAKGGPRRFSITSVPIFWLESKDGVLEERIRKRVDSMIQSGLLEEVRSLYLATPKELDEAQANHEKGIFQSIGFKELREYLALDMNDLADTSQAEKVLAAAIERIKISTRQYARRQVKWVKNRFLTRLPHEAYHVFRLDASNPDTWNETVQPVAFHIVDVYQNCNLKANTTDLLTHLLPHIPEASLPIQKKTPGIYRCPDCDSDKIYTSEEQFQLHLSSRIHHRRLASKRKRKLNDEKRPSDNVERESEISSLS